MGAYLAIAGAVIGAIGALKQGQAAQKAANYNAANSFQQAHAERLASIEESKRTRRLAGKRMGVLRSLDPDKLDLLEDSAMEEELNILTILHGGEMQAVGLENTGRLDIQRGKDARTASYYGAASGLLMGAGAAMGGGGGAGAGASSAGGVGDTMMIRSSTATL